MGNSDVPEHDRRTVFVQGISFDMQDAQFEEAFSEIGPIRKSFLLRRRGEKRHKGSGFVQFALPEDAVRAVKEYNDKSLMGRTVQVVAATKRAPLAERKQQRKDEAEEGAEAEEEQPPAKKKKVEVLVMGDKQKALRTVAVGNLSAETLEQGLEFAASVGQVECVTREVGDGVIEAAKLRQDGCTGVIVLVTFATVKGAVEAVPKLHKAGLQIGEAGGKGGKRGGQHLLWARQLKGEGSMVKKWRVIMRNLPFNVKEAELTPLLSPAGFVWELTIPQKDDGSSKGFAFASFTSRAHSEKAIKLVNGKKLKGRLIAVDWAISKSTFETGQLDAAAAASGMAVKASSDSEGESDDEADQEGDEQQVQELDANAERMLMLDVAAQFTSEGDVKEESSGRSAEKIKKKEKEATPARGVATSEAEDRQLDAAVAGPSSQEEALLRIVQAPRPVVGNTVFVRGLSSEVSKQQLQARLESFGPVRACRLVMNATTKLPKGTAFVEYTLPANAEKAAQASARGRSGDGPGVFIGGKSLDIDIALTQDDARAMAAGRNGKAGGPKDKRNVYLAKEGAIEEGSAMWQEMSKGDQEKRSRASREKATKLRSPNFYISTTRLSLRNLPYTMDEKALKTLVVAAVKERASKANPHVKQVKVLRDPTKKDSKGNPQGKGIAFAEFSDPEHALCALRQLNNNPAPFGKDRRPIVEFAVENAQTMKKREQRETGRKDKQTQEAQEQNPRKMARGKQSQHPAENSASQADEGQPALKRRKKEKADRPKAAAAPAPSEKPAASVQAPQKAGREAKKWPSPARKPDEKRAGTKRYSGADLAAETATNRPKQVEKKDALDGLIAKYRDTLFGSSKSKGTQTTSSLKRWFE